MKAFGPDAIPLLAALAELFRDRLDNPKASPKQQVAAMAMFADCVQHGGAAGAQAAMATNRGVGPRTYSRMPFLEKLNFRRAFLGRRFSRRHFRIIFQGTPV